MQFANPEYLILLILIPLLHRWWNGRNRAARLNYPLPIPKSVRAWNPKNWFLALRYFALALIVIAIARPQNRLQYMERSVTGIDIMLVLDVSLSMNAEDLADASRLEIAKETMRNFIKGRRVDRLGFAIFSGEAVTLAPPTLDYGLVLQSISEAQAGSLENGTAIGDGLAVAVSRIQDSEAKSKIIVLLTDGDNNMGQVDPTTAGELAEDAGIKVYTIAVGKEGRVKIPRRAQVGSRIVTTYQWLDNAINPELLQKISAQTDGKFYRVTDASALQSVFEEIDSLEKTEFEAQERVFFDEKFQFFLQIALVLFIAERLLTLAWWRVLT